MAVSRLSAVRLTFGKHQGELVVDVAADDPSYLRWLRENVDLRGDLRDAVELALEDDAPGEGWERYGSGWRKR